MQLKNPSLLKSQCFINGKWTSALKGTTFPVHNPSRSIVITKVPNMGMEEAKLAISAAHQALPAWKAKTGKERSLLLRRFYELILENGEDLAVLMTSEQGKPLSEAKGEIRYGASFAEWFSEEAKRVYGDIIPSSVKEQRLLVIKQPIGVVAAITPWNFPNAMIMRKCSPALAAGCTIVIKPSGKTPLSALALAELSQQAGIPPGVFNVITGDSATIGLEMSTNPLVKKITFTGSTDIGKELMAQSAHTVKKVSLELGGLAPFIIFKDADIGKAVEGVIASKFRNSGQTCVCANRIFVEDPIYQEFTKTLVQAVKNLKVGDGLEPGVQQGPLISLQAVEKAEKHIQDAVSKGAQIACGGKRHFLKKTFFEPTVLCKVTSSMLVMQEETFGPIAPLMSFSSEEEVLKIANDTVYGLASYVYTQNISRMWRVCEALETGMVSVNGGLFSNEVAPFGGIKESGIGREGSKYGIEEYLEMKYICNTI